MIGMLTGKVAIRNDPYILLDVKGVGYKVFVAPSIFTKATLGETLIVFTHTHVREDVLELFGFVAIEDLQLFEKMIGVSGIGCKTAIGIFGIGTRSEILNAIVRGDSAFFTTVPRLGKKNAQKLIIELKGKIDITGNGVEAGQGNEDREVVMQALQSFGYSAKESYDAIAASRKENESIEETIRSALAHLGRK